MTARVLLLVSLAAQAHAQVVLTDVTADSGVAFGHTHGGCGERRFVEQLGGGVALFDVDGDGRLDVFLASGVTLSGCPTPRRPRCRLYRNLGDMRFEDASSTRLPSEAVYATGCAAGDVDGDGDDDLVVMCDGPNRLYRNDGGVLRNATADSGLQGAQMSASATLVDIDLDGDLDLYVTNYVTVPPAGEPRCERRGVPTYCLPQDFRAASDRLWANDGAGRFTDVTRAAGVYRPRGRGLGVTAGDFDADGDPDLYVANDAGDNFLFRNRGDGTFTEVALLAGVALGEDGVMENGMGTDWGDFDGDGRLDLVVTNFEDQPNTLWRNLDGELFADVSYSSRTGAPGFPLLGWACLFADLDLDGWLDLFIANGHVFDNVAEFREGSAFAQPNLLFHNRGHGIFAQVGSESCPALAAIRVSRGAAAGDLDNDGDIDLVINNLDGPAEVLRNDTPRAGRRWLGLELSGRPGTRAIGARVSIDVGGRRIVREVRGATGYLSQGDHRIVIGLGEGETVEGIDVRWPGGARERFEAAGELGRYAVLKAGGGR